MVEKVTSKLVIRNNTVREALAEALATFLLMVSMKRPLPSAHKDSVDAESGLLFFPRVTSSWWGIHPKGD